METPGYRSVLKNELSKRCKRNARYSLRAYARALGFEATNVSQMMSGKRVPSLKTAQRLLRNLALSPSEERDFLVSLAREQQARSGTKLQPYLNTERTPVEEIQLQLFQMISDSCHYAILALTQVDGFKSNTKWIASQLSLTEIETKQAIDRLQDLGLLEKKQGKLRSTNRGFTTADKAVTNSGLRRHQKQILEKAMASLENDPLDQRSMTSLTMAINPKRLAEAKKKIESFTQELSEFLEEEPQKQVYQLGICLYPIQKKQEKKP